MACQNYIIFFIQKPRIFLYLSIFYKGRVHAQGILARAPNEAWDLENERKSYPYQAHRLAVGILYGSGFQSIEDKNSVQDNVLETNIRNMMPAFEEHMDEFLYEFEVRKVNMETLKVEKDRGKFLKRSLTFINSVLRKMYGIQICKSRKKGSSEYTITQNSVGKLFIISKKNGTPPYTGTVPSSSTDMGSSTEEDDMGPSKPVIFSNLEEIPIKRKFTPTAGH